MRPTPRTSLGPLCGLFCGLLWLALALPAGPVAALDAGIDYTVVDTPARAEPGDDVEVLELFWYGCPHCYQLEPALERWRATLPPGVTFRRMPAVASPRWESHARAYYVAEQLGVLDRWHPAFFKALHEQRRKLFTDDEVIAFAGELGLDAAAFRAAWNSFPVDVKVRKATELIRRLNVTGVPTLVVNGKYFTSASQTGSTAAMFAVLDQLIAQERATAGPAAGAAPETPTTAPSPPAPAAAPAAGS